MYWTRGDSLLAILPALGWFAAFAIGGWLIVIRAFRLERRERALAGTVTGLCLWLFCQNLVGRCLPPTVSFAVSALIVLLLGVGLALQGRARREINGAWSDWAVWQPWVIVAGVAIVVALVGRGVGIFDDRKNLSLISLMAAGDIPPHFYMNGDVPFRYHYGMQLVAAGLMRMAEMFPWSAFDVSKGLITGLAAAVAYLLGWRLTHRPAGGLLAAAILMLGSGSRWIMLFLPSSILRAASSGVQLIGSGANTAPTLLSGLRTGWVIEGGPPSPIPFAFANGAFEPIALSSQAGPVVLSRALLFLLLLLLPRMRSRLSVLVLSMLMSSWALVWETDFLVFGAGLLLAVLLARGRFRLARSPLIAGMLLALVLAVLQGGTLTELARGLLAPANGGGPASGFSMQSLGLRWPPAIVSAHLGSLSLLDPLMVVVGVLELGVVLLAAPFVMGRIGRWLRRGRFELAAIAIAALLAGVIPLFLRYEVDRDITRFTGFSLIVLAVIGGVIWLQGIRVRHAGLRAAGWAWLVMLCLPGVVILGSLLTAIPRAMLAEDIAPLDARMAHAHWDRLPPGALVLDSHPWRVAALFGRLTRSMDTEYDELPEWEALVSSGDPVAAAAAGYSAMYVDREWSRKMSDASRTALEGSGCAVLIDDQVDDGRNGERQLFDISGCAAPAIVGTTIVN